MFINQNTITFKAKVPLSEYKGVILKLTDGDKAKIEKLMSQKSLLELQLNSVEKMLSKKKKMIESNGLFSIYGKIQAEISDLENQIRQIKIDRKTQQTKELKKFDLMV